MKEVIKPTSRHDDDIQTSYYLKYSLQLLKQACYSTVKYV